MFYFYVTQTGLELCAFLFLPPNCSGPELRFISWIMLKLFAMVEIICDGHQQFNEDDFLFREVKTEKFDIVSIRSRTR